MKIFWRRGNERLSFDKPQTYFSLGMIGTGKSSLLEHIALQHSEKGAVVLDAYASADGENLAWLRNPKIDSMRTLLIKGENVDVDSSYDAKTIENITLGDLERYDLVISSRPLFLNRDHEFYSLGKLVTLLYKRLHWKRLICMIAREASSLWYSRIKVSESQADSKNEAMYLLRESRHMGISLALDSLRFLSIDVDLRSHVDFLFLKSLGLDGLSQDQRWLYHFFDPRFVRSMRPWEFVLITRSGGLGVGLFPEILWHKKEKENILRSVNIRVGYGAELEQPRDMGTFTSIGDKEHMKIMELYASGLGYTKIHERLNRSTKSLHDHIHKHNDAVDRSGFCAICRRAGGEYSGKVVKKRKAEGKE